MLFGLDILRKAGNLITGDRAKQHGDFVKNHENIAKLFSAFINTDVTTSDALLMMAQVKLARTKEGQHNIDDYIDACGYIALAGQLASQLDEQKNLVKNYE